MIGFRLDGVIILIAFDAYALPFLLHHLRSSWPVNSIVSVLMTGLFIWPLLRTRLGSPQLKHIARRSVIAAFVVLGTSCVNITVLCALNGQECGWICLVSWEGDVRYTR